MNFPITKRLRDLTKLLALCTCITSASAATYESPPPEIVSAWKANSENIVAVFTHDGTYYLVDDESIDPGMERGNFTWDKTSHAFNAETIIDTNGEGGFSHPAGATTIFISGNTLTYNVVGEGPFTFTRVSNTATAIVGSWYIPGERTTLTFLSDNSYYFAQETNDSPFGYDGIERGNYIWNASTKSLSATPLRDTNGDIGLSDLPPTFTATITGNSMVLADGSDTFNARRITPITTPLNTEVDFEVSKFANYRQTSNSSPTLLTGSPSNPSDDFPFWGEAYIEDSVSGTGGTLSITGKSAIDFEDDDGWSIETEYTSEALLTAAFPNSNSVDYVFSRTGSSATLKFPAGSTFPVAPKLQIGNGTWINGQYHLGNDQTLTWSPQASYSSTTMGTILTVVDNANGAEILYEDVIQGDITSYDLSGKLEPGHTYDVQLEHVKIASTTTSGSGVYAGKLGLATLNSNTRFQMVAPDASEYPNFWEHPLSQAGFPGSPLVLSVSISEDAFPFSTFQWFKNNEEIEGQTGNSLFIPSFNLTNDSGRYTVTASNSGGAATSNIANVGTVGTNSMAVQNINAYKSKISSQTTASLLTPTGAEFDARIEGVGITNTFPSSAPTLTKPDNSTLALFFDDDHWDANQNDFASFAALQAAFPDGTYKINIGPTAIFINLSATNYPNQPLITPSTGTWVNGKLQITASQAAAGFTLTSNATTGNGFANLYVIDIVTDDDIVSAHANTHSGDTKFVVATVNPSQLTVGKTYEVETQFDEVIHTTDITNNSWTSPPPATTAAYGRLNTTTRFTIEVVADPTGSSYTTWQSGFFNPTQLGNSAISGDDVDFDNDGIPNLLEFVLGGSPTASNPGLLKSATTTPAAVGRNLVFFYDRKIAANGIIQGIETSATLTGVWTPAVHGQNNVTITTATTVDPTVERVTATIPTTATKLFVRLRASR